MFADIRMSCGREMEQITMICGGQDERIGRYECTRRGTSTCGCGGMVGWDCQDEIRDGDGI